MAQVMVLNQEEYTVRVSEKPVVPDQGIQFFKSWDEAKSALENYLTSEDPNRVSVAEFMNTWQYKCSKLNSDGTGSTTWSTGVTFHIVNKDVEDDKGVYIDDFLNGVDFAFDPERDEIRRIPYKIERVENGDEPEPEPQGIRVVDGAEFFAKCELITYNNKEIRVYNPESIDDVNTVVNYFREVTGEEWRLREEKPVIIDDVDNDVFESLEADRKEGVVGVERCYLLFLDSEYGTIIQELYDSNIDRQVDAFMIEDKESPVLIDFATVANNKDLDFTNDFVSTTLYNAVTSGDEYSVNIAASSPFINHLTPSPIDKESILGYAVLVKNL